MKPDSDTPPGGDFVRYIEKLHAQQAHPPMPPALPPQPSSPAPTRAAPDQAAAATGPGDVPPGAEALLNLWRRVQARQASHGWPRPFALTMLAAVAGLLLYLLWEGGGLFFIPILVVAWLNWQKLRKQKSDRLGFQERQRQILADALRHLQDKKRP